MALPVRKRLYHVAPAWVPDGAMMFITISCDPRGTNQLATPERSLAIFDAVRTYVRSERWWVETMLLMPDHLHAFISFSPCERMASVVRQWKTYLARTQGIQWQDGFFEHRLRSPESSNEKWHYVMQNPVRAGLATSPEEWRYVFFAQR